MIRHVTRWTSTQRSTDRHAREPTGPNRSEIFNFLLILVRSEGSIFAGPGTFLGLGPNRSVRNQPVLVRGSLVHLIEPLES